MARSTMRLMLLSSLVLMACGPQTSPGPAPGSGKCTVETWGAPFNCVVLRQPSDGRHHGLTLWPGTNDIPPDAPYAVIVGDLAFVGGVFVGGACTANYNLGLERTSTPWQTRRCRLTVTSTTRSGTGYVVQGTIDATIVNGQGGTQQLYAGF